MALPKSASQMGRKKSTQHSLINHGTEIGAAEDPLTVYQKMGGDSLHFINPGDLALLVEGNGIGQLELPHKEFHLCSGLPDVDRQDHESSVFGALVEFLDDRHLPGAAGAPIRPKPQKHHLPSELTQFLPQPAETSKGEIGCFLSNDRTRRLR